MYSFNNTYVVNISRFSWRTPHLMNLGRQQGPLPTTEAQAKNTHFFQSLAAKTKVHDVGLTHQLHLLRKLQARAGAGENSLQQWTIKQWQQYLVSSASCTFDKGCSNEHTAATTRLSLPTWLCGVICI